MFFVYIDFEFKFKEGERPEPICFVLQDSRSKVYFQYWHTEFSQGQKHLTELLSTGGVLVAFNAVAEISCLLALNWPVPLYALDFMVEFKLSQNGLGGNKAPSLLDVLKHYHLASIDKETKTVMREKAQQAQFTATEKQEMLGYCQSDVESLSRLHAAMYRAGDFPIEQLPYALNRGAYMVAVACMEHVGIPFDRPYFEALKTHWESFKEERVLSINTITQKVFKETFFLNNVFNEETFRQVIDRTYIDWPKTDFGKVKHDDDTLKDMSKIDPRLKPIREGLQLVGRLKKFDLFLGQDSRARCSLWPYSSRTGRNQPGKGFVFILPSYLRSLIQAPSGWAVSYLDFSQQEFAIAAVLSSDPAMIADYCSGDTYIGFGKRIEYVPEWATKKTHPRKREILKQILLAIQYGMGHRSLALRLGVPIGEAAAILEAHKRAYPLFWKWSETIPVYSYATGAIQTLYGWKMTVGDRTNRRTLLNYPMQANGGEILRRSCISLVRAGIEVCAPVHDALLIAYPVACSEALGIARELMVKASSEVLKGFPLRVGEETFAHPKHFIDQREAKDPEKVDTLAELRKFFVRKGLSHELE